MTTPIDIAALRKLLRDEAELGAVAERLGDPFDDGFPSSGEQDAYEDAVMASDGSLDRLEEAAVEALPALLDELDRLRAAAASAVGVLRRGGDGLDHVTACDAWDGSQNCADRRLAPCDGCMAAEQVADAVRLLEIGGPFDTFHTIDEVARLREELAPLALVATREAPDVG